MTAHACPDCGAEHAERVPTPEERIAALEDEVAQLRADAESAETARALERALHVCPTYLPFLPCTRPHSDEPRWWWSPIISSGGGIYTTPTRIGWTVT
jgi:hypothetical protein